MPDEIPENPDEVEGLNEAAESWEDLTPPADVDSERSTRTPWKKYALVAGGAAAVVGVGIAVAWSKGGLSLPVARDVSVPSQAVEAVRRPLDHQVTVRQHLRRQRYGTNRSLMKEITIHEHVRGPKAA